MKTFDFLVDRMPFGYAFNFDNYLFNKVKHINTQEVRPRADYFLVNNVKKRIEGKIHFLIKDQVAYSPYKSLFGSFEFSSRIHPQLLTDFWQFIESDLMRRGCESVKITSFAECYAPAKSKTIFNTLTNNGFEIGLKAANHHIDVKDEPLDYRMHVMEVRRLKKCMNDGFEFAREPIENAEAVFNFLKECRAEVDLTVSISKEKLLMYLDLFPQNYLFFSVRSRGEIAAATIAIKVHRQILYNFLPGSKRAYHNYSPTVMLNAGLYQYCRDHQIELLDLGISTEPDGTDQESLITFKENIGAKQSYKYFFEKNL